MRLGAQDIIGKPFSNEQLLAKVKALLQRARGEPGAGVSPDTRADVLEALRRSAGLTRDSGTMTSEELFGDLIGDEGEPGPADDPAHLGHAHGPARRPRASPGASRRGQARPSRSAAPVGPPASGQWSPTRPWSASSRRPWPISAPMRPGRRVREDTDGASVDALLSQTLSGLDVRAPEAGAQARSRYHQRRLRPEPQASAQAGSSRPAKPARPGLQAERRSRSLPPHRSAPRSASTI